MSPLVLDVVLTRLPDELSVEIQAKQASLPKRGVDQLAIRCRGRCRVTRLMVSRSGRSRQRLLPSNRTSRI